MIEASEVAWGREVEELTRSVAQLIAQCESQRRQLLERDGEMASLRERVRSLEAELAAVKEESSTASAGRAFGPNSRDSQEAKKMIKSMLREIDACIALLRG